MFLLAQEVSTTQLGVLVTLAGLFGSGVTAVVTWAMKYRGTIRAEQEKQETKITSYLDAALQRAKDELREKQQEVKELRETTTQMVFREARLRAYVDYAQGLLQQGRRAFKPFREDDDQQDGDIGRRNTPPEGYNSGS